MEVLRMTKKKQPDKRKARAEPYVGKIPTPGQAVSDNERPKTAHRT
jgi:hypothetical protein